MSRHIVITRWGKTVRLKSGELQQLAYSGSSVVGRIEQSEHGWRTCIDPSVVKGFKYLSDEGDIIGFSKSKPRARDALAHWFGISLDEREEYSRQKALEAGEAALI